MSWINKSFTIFKWLLCENPISLLLRSISFHNSCVVFLQMLLFFAFTNSLWILFMIFRSQTLERLKIVEYLVWIIIVAVSFIACILLSSIYFLFSKVVLFFLFRKIQRQLKSASEILQIQNLRPPKFSIIYELKPIQKVIFELTEKIKIYTSHIPKQELKKIEEEMQDRLFALRNSIKEGVSYEQIKSFRNSARISLSDSYSITVAALPGQVFRAKQSRKNTRRAPVKSPGSSRISGRSSRISSRSNISNSDIGLYTIDTTVMCVKVLNFSSLFSDPDSFVKQFEVFSSSIYKIIRSSKAQITNFDADTIIFFWDSNKVKNHEFRACDVANRIIQTILELNIMWDQEKKFDLGIGIASGESLVGNMGFEGEMKKFSIHSYTCDVAVSLSELCSQWKIDCLIDCNVHPRIKNHFLSRIISLDHVVNSKHSQTPAEPICAIQLGKRMKLGEDEWLYSLQNQLAASLWDKFNQAMEYYRSEDSDFLGEALTCLKKHIEILPNDYPGLKWMEKIEKELKHKEETMIESRSRSLSLHAPFGASLHNPVIVLNNSSRLSQNDASLTYNKNNNNNNLGLQSIYNSSNDTESETNTNISTPEVQSPVSTPNQNTQDNQDFEDSTEYMNQTIQDSEPQQSTMEAYQHLRIDPNYKVNSNEIISLTPTFRIDIPQYEYE